MSTIVTRAGKGSPLTNTEMDANFTNLNADKLEVATAAATYQPLDGDLTAIAALASTGYAKRTGTNTWSVSATIPGSDITGAIDSVTVGLTTPAAGRFSTLLVNAASFVGGEKLRISGDAVVTNFIGVSSEVLPTTFVSLGGGNIHSSAATKVYGVQCYFTAPATATSSLTGMTSALGNVAGAYTVGEICHFDAVTTNKGAGSTITVSKGYSARNAIATGSSSYGFWSDIASATNTYQLYMVGTAANHIASDLRIGTTSLVGAEKLRVAGITNTDSLVVNTLATISPSSLSTMDNVTIGTTTSSFARFTHAGFGNAADARFSLLINAPPSAGTALTAVGAYLAGPATATTSLSGFTSAPSTNASAYTCSNIYHFYALATTKGAGSTITNVFGFRVDSGAMTGINNYGVYLDIPATATNHAIYSTGLAKVYINGEFGVKTTADTAISISIGTPSSTGSILTGTYTQLSGPTTASTQLVGTNSLILTAAAAYSVGSVIHYFAGATSKGAGSTITESHGFKVSNSIAVGTANYGFYSDINTATTTYQLYMAGTAPSYFAGDITINSGKLLGWGSATAPDTFLARDAANTLAMKNSTTAQAFRVYGTTTGPKYLSLSHDGTNAIVDTNASGGRLSLGGNASSIFGLSNLLFTDNAFDIGASGANRPRSGFFAAAVTLGTTLTAGTSVISPIFATSAAGNIAVNTNTSTQQFGIVHTASAARYITVTGSVSGNPILTTTAGALTIGVGVAHPQSTVTYSASMTPDASLGNNFVITITNGTAHTINAPTNPTTGQEISFTLRNTSGGVAGAATWNAVFKMVAWTQAANGFSRSIYFVYNGTNWVETGRSAADVAN